MLEAGPWSAEKAELDDCTHPLPDLGSGPIDMMRPI